MPSPTSRIPRPILYVLVLMAVGCATVKPPTGTALVPTDFQTRTGPYCVFTGAPLPADAPAIRHLQSLELQLASTLGVRAPEGTDPIEIYILDGPDEFRHFLTFYHPDLPARRAFFLAKGSRRVVYTYQGVRLDEDLRHEATHALLHAAIPDLPLWIDEGLAEYFEVDEAKQGRNAEHLARLPDDLASGFRPDLKRLEGLKDVRKMTPRDYRESWAWVHYCLNGPPEAKSALLGYLADRHQSGDHVSLSKRLALALPDASERVVEHIEASRSAESNAKIAREGEEKLRLQNRPVEIRAPTLRRGILARIAGIFGIETKKPPTDRGSSLENEDDGARTRNLRRDRPVL